jgi:membrane protein
MYPFFIDTIKAWIDHRAASKGAALAFYTLFSMTPILMLVIAVAGYFFGEDAARGQLMAQISGQIGPNGAQAIQTLLAASRDTNSGIMASVVATLLMLIGATSVFTELKISLDEIWGCNQTSQSPVGGFIKTRVLSFMLILILALLLVASLVANAVFIVLENYAVGIRSSFTGLFSLLSSLVSYGVIACLFAVIYKTLPEEQLPWSDVWVGAAFTSLFFSLGKYAIGLYLSNSGISSIFGAAGSLIALLLWIYYSAQIFFLGAEFTRQYALRFGSLQQRR